MPAGKVVKILNRKIRQFKKENKDSLVNLMIELHEESNTKKRVSYICWQPCKLRSVVNRLLIGSNSDKSVKLPNMLILKIDDSDDMFYRPEIIKGVQINNKKTGLAVYSMEADENIVYVKWQIEASKITLRPEKIMLPLNKILKTYGDDLEINHMFLSVTNIGSCNKYYDFQVDTNKAYSKKQFISLYKDKRFVSKVDISGLENIPKWVNINDSPPLDFDRARDLARDYLENKFKDIKNLDFYHAALMRMEKNDWIYSFTFISGTNPRDISSLEVPVLMDGTVGHIEETKTSGSKYALGRWYTPVIHCD